MKIAVFVDFHGTIGGEGTEDVRALTLYPFAAEAIGRLNAQDLLVIGITNQSRIARGEFSLEEFDLALRDIRQELAQSGAHFDAVYCCPHGREDFCSCKKPLRGMVDSACAEFDIDCSRSYVIGDMGMNDMVLAKNIGAKGILVLTGVGQGSLSTYRHTWQDCDAYHVASDIAEAVDVILADVKACSFV